MEKSGGGGGGEAGRAGCRAGAAFISRLRPFCSATGFFAAILAALCIAGLYLIATAQMIPVSQMAGVFAMRAGFLIVCGILAQLLRAMRARRLSGVGLKDDTDGRLIDA